MSRACEQCLRRTWLMAQLAGHLDRARAHIAEVLSLDDDALLQAVGGRRRDEVRRGWAGPEPQRLRAKGERAGLELICRCDPRYPARLRDLASPPAVLHVAGGLERFLAGAATEAVALVGSRAASSYGTGVARSLARGLASAGVPVISGMAAGIDSSAHRGALSVGAPALPVGAPALPGDPSGPDPSALTIAVLPGPADRAYPRGASGLYRQIVRSGSAVSEMPPGTPVRSWMFLARNRTIAAMAVMTIVVEAGTGSGALLTAHCARAAGRAVGAVPGQVTTPQARGPNQLIREGAHVVSGAQDVLDLLFEAGSRSAPMDDRPALNRELTTLLAAVAEGHDTPAALIRHGALPEQGLAALASLELAGYVARGPGGRFTVVP
ncbi:MAG TPA: DNA-processing protein DprA [Solirubrobacteraceae bacterium]|nr:DNA-processing protein DprA [Solirubrobacteraceae bacterium]